MNSDAVYDDWTLWPTPTDCLDITLKKRVDDKRRASVLVYSINPMQSNLFLPYTTRSRKQILLFPLQQGISTGHFLLESPSKVPKKIFDI